MKRVELKIGSRVRWAANWNSMRASTLKISAFQRITVDAEVESQITIFTLTRNNPYEASRQ